MTRISVALAAHNGAAFIEEQLRSILVQLGGGDEVIVVDDASTDDTAAIVESIADPRIRLIRSNVNRGYVRTFAAAMRAAGGDVVLLADQDDVWRPGRVAAMAAALATADVVATNLAVHGRSGGLRGPYGQADWHLRAGDSRRHLRNIAGIYAGNRPYYGSAMGMRRSALDVILPFPRYLPEQYDLWIALYGNLARSIVHLDIRSIEHRFHGANDTPNRPRWGLTVLYTRARLLVMTGQLLARLVRRGR